MYVCICKRVTSKTVARSIAAGAKSVTDVQLACRAGTDCGCCHSAIELMLVEQTQSPEATATATSLSIVG